MTAETIAKALGEHRNAKLASAATREFKRRNALSLAS